MRLLRTTEQGTEGILSLATNKVVTTPDMVRISFHSYQEDLTDVMGTIYKQNTEYVAPAANLGEPIIATEEEMAAEGYEERFVTDTRSEGQKEEYILAENCGPHLIGVYDGDLDSATYRRDLHEYAAQKLGSNFEISI